MKARTIVTSGLLLVTWACVSVASPIERGTTILAFQLTAGVADFVTPEGGSGYIAAFDHSEIGVQAQLLHLVSEDWALAASGGIGFFKETDDPGINASLTDTKFEYSQSSWQLRGGVDRVVHISKTFHLYTGPGLQVWSGHASFEGGDVGPKVESENTTRIALSGRFGAHVKLGESVGLMGQVGHHLGHASAKDAGAEAKWWPSGWDGAGGLAFHF